jgi:hypothetical protein
MLVSATKRLLLPAILLLTAAGCTPFGENSRIERGIGTDLYTSETARNTQLLDLYLRHMCVQGGVGRLDDQNRPFCGMDGSDSSGWTLVVKAGFNDIDRRCDAYLAWLNSKRRTNNSVLNQLSQTATATQSIMRIAGASANPLTLVGIGFGLTRDTFTNYYSRLLLEVESSTVELVVTENRNQFRDAFADTAVQYRPDAVHILRSYLLICTPHVIENNINIRTRFSVAGNIAPPQNDYADQVRKSLTKAALLRTAPTDPRGKLKPQEPGPGEKFITGAKTADEKTINRPSGIRIQENLCVSPADGKFGKITRGAIVMAKQAQPGAFGSDTSDTLNNDAQIKAILRQDSCLGNQRLYANAYEKFKFFDESKIRNFQASLALCDALVGKIADPNFQSAVTKTGKFDANTRAAILAVKSKLKDPAISSEATSNQVFAPSFNAIIRCDISAG